MRRTLGWIGQVISWLVILGVVAVLAAAVVVPRLAGAAPYTVLTGSMKPSYPPGTLVVVKPLPFDEIVVGDVITYQLESGKATVVTHRVTEVNARLDGKTVLTTQGDANNAADPERVEAVQVRGRLWYSVPYLGYVNNALSGGQRQTAVLVVSVALVGYAAFMFVGAIRERRRSRTQPVGEVPDEPNTELNIQMPVHREPQVPRDGAPRGRSLAGAVLGVLVLGLAYRLVRARRGRSTDRAPR